MKTSLEVDGLLAPPQPLPAANEEFVATPAQSSAGWDPFEVWRTRVRATPNNQKPEAALS